MKNNPEPLKDIYFFSPLSEHDIKKIKEVCQEERFEKGEIVFKEGSSGDNFFIILEGSIEIFKNYDTPDRDLLAVYGKGQLFGEIALIDDLPRSATVITREPTRLLSISRDNFNRIISEASTLSISIMKSISAKIRDSNENFIKSLRERNRHLEEIHKQLKQEIEDRKWAEDRLVWQARVNEAIAKLSKALISSLSIDEISSMILEKAKQITESEYGYTAYIQVHKDYLAYPPINQEVWIKSTASDKDFTLERTGGLWEWVSKNKKTLLSNNPEEDQRYSGIPEDFLPFRNFLSAPVIINDMLMGQIAVADSTRDYSDRDIRLLQELADLYAIAIQRKISEDERDTLQMQLQHSQRLESIGILAGGIAHDFNNILFPIIGYTEMSMIKIAEGNDIRKNLEEIFKAANRARNLIQQILTFSRRSNRERKPLKVQSVIKETLDFLMVSMEKNIEIHQNIDRKCGYILGDRTQIHQVIMNLCTNAYHAMQEKGGILEVSLNQVKLNPYDIVPYMNISPGSYLHLSVRDTGYGMKRSVMERIFDPFFTTKAPGKGTGMGLSVVHGIVKSYDGCITVYSEPGKGSIFHVYLPLMDTPETNLTELSFEEPPTGDERILLADDEEQVLNMLQKMLEQLGYQVKAFISSPEAYQQFENSPDNFDLVITDMAMPKMTGEELAKKIMAIRSDIPIILCTGFSEKMSEEKAKSLGIREFVMKPVIRGEIARIIRRALKN